MATTSTNGSGDDAREREASPDLERLTRWHTAGGGWRVEARTPRKLVVSLLTCDGGEEMERIVSTDPAFIDHVGNRTSSES